jgi:hypothetical protein
VYPPRQGAPIAALFQTEDEFGTGHGRNRVRACFGRRQPRVERGAGATNGVAAGVGLRAGGR